MELNEFVANTILDVYKGLEDADKKLEGDYHIVNKSIDIDFDVAVTTIEGEEVSGGGGIQVASILKAGGEYKTTSENSNVSRIKFTVPFRTGKAYSVR